MYTYRDLLKELEDLSIKGERHGRGISTQEG